MILNYETIAQSHGDPYEPVPDYPETLNSPNGIPMLSNYTNVLFNENLFSHWADDNGKLESSIVSHLPQPRENFDEDMQHIANRQAHEYMYLGQREMNSNGLIIIVGIAAIIAFIFYYTKKRKQ